MRTALFVLLCLTSAAHADNRAKTFVTSQLDSIKKGDTDAIRATFASDAIILGIRDGAPANLEASDFLAALMNGSPHSVFKKVAIKSIVSGGNDTVMWLTADLLATYESNEPEEKPDPNAHELTRITELVALDGSTWKVVAAAVTAPNPAESRYDPKDDPIPSATKPGPLAPLVAAPADLAKRLSTDKNTYVFGTDTKERAVGAAAAKKLLGQWTKLGMKIDPAPVREVETKTYGFAQASVVYSAPSNHVKDKTVYYHMQALIIALPDGADWRVVAVHYINR